MWGIDFTDYFVTLFIVAVLIGAALSACLIFGIPIVWEWLRPIIHAATGAA
mgnify:CR=1 FL=1